MFDIDPRFERCNSGVPRKAGLCQLELGIAISRRSLRLRRGVSRFSQIESIEGEVRGAQSRTRKTRFLDNKRILFTVHDIGNAEVAAGQLNSTN